jgi:integrase
MYQVSKGTPWIIRIQNRSGDVVRVSTGTPDKDTASAVEAMVLRFKREHRHEAIEAIVSKKLSLVDAFVAYTTDRLPEVLAALRDADLNPLVTEWERQGANPRYVMQVRNLIKPGERFPASHFRRKTVSVFLAALPVSGSTRNRYKAALSVFAKWLVEREVIETNPVRDVKSAKPNPARMVWLERKDAKRLIDALPEPYKALEALMAGTGMEWSAIENTRRSDVDTKTRTIHAQGTKNTHRNRKVRVTEDWTWPIIQRHLKGLLPTAPLFSVKHDIALDVHHEAARAIGLPKSTLHDWRHTYAVNALKDGVSPAVVKRQLGHAPNSTVVERVYGVWIVDESDYQKRRKNG